MSDTFADKFMQGPEDGRDKAVEVEAADTDSAKAGEAGVSLKDRVIEALQEIYDPEIPVNIYELGLIYGLEIGDDGKVDITMTLTTPMCPVADQMPGEVEARVAQVEGVGDVSVELVWEPPWDPSMLSEAAKLELGML